MLITLSKIKADATHVTLLGLLLAGASLSSMSWAAITTGNTTEAGVPAAADPDEVQFAANAVSYDETTQVITAEGQVEITQDGKIVRANQVIYNLPEDKVTAVGEVVMLEPSGNVHFADRVELEQKLKNGYVKKLRSVLADGSRFAAEEGQRIAGTKTVMSKASYTPCEPCKANPEKAPLWQLVADKVTLDEVDHSVSYDNARFEVYGVPVAYTPYFVHPDGTVKQKSGFMPPKFLLDSQLGFGVGSNYYWAIDESQDATIGARVFTKDNPQLLGEYRRRFDAAELQLNGSFTYSDSDENDKTRGHLFGKGLWELNDKWRAGFNAQVTSDDRYLRRYGISNDTVLENEIYAERFDDRDYFVARALAFQDIRISDRSADQPNILPELNASFMGDPNGLLGGRWDLDLSSLNLLRKGNGQDVFRVSSGLGWQRRDVSSFGLVNVFNIKARTDMYEISDRDEMSLVGGSGGPHAFRFYPLMHDELSYPMVRNFATTQMVIEPKVSVSASTRIKNDTDIPNEDSQDVQIDALNIFDDNRFPGLDRVEDRTRVTYGLRTGLYKDDGSMGEVFLGQSYRLDDKSNPFPEGSGLSDEKSDIVGNIIGRYRDRYSLNYKFQLGSQNLEAQRHELDGMAMFGDLTLNTTYLYLRGLEGTDLTDSRQQIYGDISYMMTEDWKLSTAARYDFSADEEGLRYTDLGVEYVGQCASFGIRARRNFTYEDTGDNGTEITMQLGLKNLGSVGTK